MTIFVQFAGLGMILIGAFPVRLKNLHNDQRSFRMLGIVVTVVCGMVLLSPMSGNDHFCVMVQPQSLIEILSESVWHIFSTTGGTGLSLS